MAVISVDEARAILWERFERGPVVDLPLAEAMGLVLARELHSDLEFPPFDRVAMDGYALRAADTAGASEDSPVTLRVIGASMAGAPYEGRVGPGEATKAMTGAPLPLGADAVVPVEGTDGYHEETAVIRREVTVGQHFARRGEDLAEGGSLLEGGVRLGSRHVQALASAGWAWVPVIAAPRTIVFSTGDELVPIEARPGLGQIRESNNVCIQAILAEWGIAAENRGALGDDEELLRTRLAVALGEAELLVLSGGVSMGEKDLVKPVLRSLGVELHFESLHVKPGHPATFGTHAGGAVFALPGNPVSVFVGLQAIYSAGLRKRLGCLSPVPPPAWGRLGFPYFRKGNRPSYLPVILQADTDRGLPRLLPTGHHGSGDFTSLARCQGLAWFSDQQHEFSEGSVVPLLRLDARDSA